MFEPGIGSDVWRADQKLVALVEQLFLPMRWHVSDIDDGAVERVRNSVTKGFRERLREYALDGGKDFDQFLDDVTATDVLNITRRGPDTPNVGSHFGGRYERAVEKVQDRELLRLQCHQMKMLLCLHPDRSKDVRSPRRLAELANELGLARK